MQVTAICNPLADLRCEAVAQIFRQQWSHTRNSVKTADQIHTFLFSQGRFTLNAGTGLQEMLCTELNLVSEKYVLLDFAQNISWMGEQFPVESSYLLGRKLKQVLKTNPEQIQIHLPRFSQYSDLGMGFLLAFDPANSGFTDYAGQDLFARAVSFSDAQIAQCIANLRELTSKTSLMITYSDPQSLFGFSGMAKAWTKYGVCPQKAQEAEKQLGLIAARLEKIMPKQNLFTSPRQMLAAGVGGGLGFLFNLLGFPIFDLSDFIFSHSAFKERFETVIGKSDLVFYFSAQFGAQIPKVFTTIADIAGSAGVPLVLISDGSGFRRGDLPRFGLAGSYDLRDLDDLNLWSEEGNFPKISFPDLEKEISFLHQLRLIDAVKRSAQTWGW